MLRLFHFWKNRNIHKIVYDNIEREKISIDRNSEENRCSRSVGLF